MRLDIWISVTFYLFIYWIKDRQRGSKIRILVQGMCWQYMSIAYSSFVIHRIKTPTSFGKYVDEVLFSLFY